MRAFEISGGREEIESFLRGGGERFFTYRGNYYGVLGTNRNFPDRETRNHLPENDSEDYYVENCANFFVMQGFF